MTSNKIDMDDDLPKMQLLSELLGLHPDLVNLVREAYQKGYAKGYRIGRQKGWKDRGASK